MQGATKFLSVLAVGFVVLAFVLRAAVPQTLFRIGVGNRVPQIFLSHNSQNSFSVAGAQASEGWFAERLCSWA
jgi:hypothetical protein